MFSVAIVIPNAYLIKVANTLIQMNKQKFIGKKSYKWNTLHVDGSYELYLFQVKIKNFTSSSVKLTNCLLPKKHEIFNKTNWYTMKYMFE